MKPSAKTIATSLVVLLITGVLVSRSGLAQSSQDHISISSAAALQFGSSNANSVSSVFDDPTNSGIRHESVNLYTGQVAESFPLMQVSARGGLSLSVGLDYAGNVSSIVHSENRRLQTSPFGLGFSLDVPYIIVDHRSTTTIDDDTYQLFIGGSIVNLKLKSGSDYRTIDGRPWKIARVTASVSGRTYVTGWTIVTEDGTVQCYGDLGQDLSNLNATENILHWGDWVGAGVTNYDSIYPYRWDLKTIRDHDDLNRIELHYLRDSAWLTEMNSAGTSTVLSVHPYVRASYIDTIRSADGQKIVFKYASRSDYQTYNYYNCYEFFQTKHIDEILQLDASDSVVNRDKFTFSYLNDDKGSAFSKLLLSKIERTSSDGALAMTPLSFSYDMTSTSPTLGTVSSICFPQGGVKEFTYTQVSSDSVFSRLDSKFRDHIPTIGERGHLYVANDMFLLNDTSRFDYFGVWDGYWKLDSVNARNTYMDGPAVSPGHWAVTYDSVLSKFIVIRWTEFGWQLDTLADQFSREGNVWIYPAEDCFLAITGPYIGSYNSVTRAYFYKRRNDSWRGWQVKGTDKGSGIYGSVQVAGDMYAIAWKYDTTILLFHDTLGAFQIGKYDQSGDSVVKYHESFSPLENEPVLTDSRVSLNTDMVTVARWRTLRSFRYDYSAKVWDIVLDWHLDPQFWRNCVSYPGGFSATYDNPDNTECELASKFINGSHSSFQAGNLAINQNEEITRLQASNTALVMQYWRYNQDSSLHLWHWNGLGWEFDHTIQDGGAFYDRELQLFQDSYAWGNTYYGAGRAEIGRYHGSNPWVQEELVLPNAGGSFVASEDGLAYEKSLKDSLILYRPYYSPVYRKFEFGSVYNCPYGWLSSYYLQGDNLYAHHHYYPTCSYYDAAAYKIIDTLHAGKPPLTVVSSVATRRFPGDTGAIKQDYQYYAGLLDATARTPRFARAKVSVPYFASDQQGPVGWVVHCFYNDIDTSGFYDAAVYSGMSFPDLKSQSRYGIANGGFRLDGTEYLNYSYTVGDSPSKHNDTTRSYHSVHRTVDTLPDVYVIRLDSVHVCRDSLTSDVGYRYDPVSGMTTSTWTKHINSNMWLVDSVAYAWRHNSSMQSDNALTQVAASYHVLDSAGAMSRLGRDSIAWERHGDWKPVKKYNWRWAALDTARVLTSSLLDGNQSFDAYGNVTTTLSAAGDTSTTKLDATSTRPVASAANCAPWDLLVQDFEQPLGTPGQSGSGWDRWTLMCDTPGVQASISDPLTGTKALKIWYDVANPPADQKVWAISRDILADSLTDSLYLASAWVKANHDAFLYVWAKDASDSILDYMVLDYVAPAPNSNIRWKQMEKVFHIRHTYGTHSLARVSIILGAHSATFDTNYAYFDNIRFHRVRGQVSTIVYGNGGATVVAVAGPDNVPVTTTYDAFHRPGLVKNFRGDTLSSSEISFPITPKNYSAVADGGGVTDSAFDTVRQVVSVNYSMSAQTDGGVSEVWIWLDGNLKHHLTCGSSSCSYDGSFDAMPGQVVKAKATTDTWGHWAKCRVTYTQPPVDMDHPNFTKGSRLAGGNRIVSEVMYFDGFGRTIQTRTLDSVNGEERAIVAGLATYDARGRVLKAYKPYHDLVGSTGLMDYSPWSTAISEVREYYDGNPGPNCDTFPYSENLYYPTVQGRLKKTALPGTAYHLQDNGYNTLYRYSTDTAHKIQGSAAVDEDMVVDSVDADQWGRWSKSVDSVCTHNGADTSWRVKQISYKDIQGREYLVADSIYIVSPGSGSQSIPLRKAWYNDLGQQDSTWKVDYGMIRMRYDRAGRLRFMQNDLRQQENKFVYFKYDAVGRKIEEGIMGSASTYSSNQDSADSKTFPTSGNSPNARYHWYFDYFADTLWSPGKLVRVTDSAAQYYRNFKYYPTGDSDQTFVRPPGLGERKIITHYYNRDGSLAKLRIQPKHSTTSGTRLYTYEYDAAGRLKSVFNDLAPEAMAHTYARYSYNPDGGVSQVVLGSYLDSTSYPVDSGSAQAIDYQYDALGRLLSQNDTTGVVSSLSGGGASNDHFGQILTYHVGESGYYNGRLYENSSATSSGSSVLKRRWRYSYNNLGWLTFANADDTSQHYFDERFDYDRMGRRTRSILYNAYGNADSVTYTYDTSLGSSKLTRYSSMTAGKYLRYDALGNLTSDSARNLLQLSWDYRNLMTLATMTGVTTNWYNYVACKYDEAGNRIQKSYTWTYWTSCIEPQGPQPGGPDAGTFPLDTLGGGMVDTTAPSDSVGLDPTSGSLTSGGVGPLNVQQCPASTGSSTYYLYDDGILLATFDGTGDVIDMYVVGPGGNEIAAYHLNSDSSLNYFMQDHLGSTRIAAKGTPFGPYAVSAYFNYLPFGGTQESWVSYMPQMQFTNHEHDQNGYFDYYNFGARLYDPKVGLFLTPDKAGQFASGYVYGGNSPAIGIDGDGNFFGLVWWLGQLAVNAAIAAAPAAAVGAATSAATYTAFNLDHWSIQGMLKSAEGGAIGGAAGSVLGSVSGGVSKVIGGGAKPSALRGVFGTAVGSAVSNMAIGYAGGASSRDLWKWGMSGFATGAVGASAGFGMARHGMAGRLGFQALTSSFHSVGNAWASGSRKPFSNFTFGLGPLNFRITDGNLGLRMSDNVTQVVGNGIGFANMITGGKARFDASSLSFSFSRGWVGSVYDWVGQKAGYGKGDFATGAFVMFSASGSASIHESQHIWQSRAMGNLFLPTYLYNASSAWITGNDPHNGNWWEQQAGPNDDPEYDYVF